MKKSIISMLIILLMLCGSTYFVGEMLQKSLEKLLTQEEGLETELVSYEKSFLTAKMQVKVTIPIDNEMPLVMLIDSDMYHYPYKATKINHITFLDTKLDEKLTQFFQHKAWLDYREEFDLLGNMSGEIHILAGTFDNQIERFQSKPLAMHYQYSLGERSGDINVEWPGFNGKIDDTIIEAANIKFNADFSAMTQTGLNDYGYFAEVESVSMGQFQNQLLTKSTRLKDIWLKGNSRIGKDKLTVDTQNNLKVAEYSNGQQSFVDNQFNLSLTRLDLAALTTIKSGNEDPLIIQQALSVLFQRGANINLHHLRSTTPWGAIDGQFNMELQPGANLVEVVGNPFNLIDYLNGQFSLLLPQALLKQSGIGPYLQVGLDNYLLQEQGEQLLLESSLDRGELVINGNVIPM